MRGLRHRNRTKVFNPPYFKSTIYCQGRYGQKQINWKLYLSKINISDCNNSHPLSYCATKVFATLGCNNSNPLSVTMQLKYMLHFKNQNFQWATHEKEIHKWIIQICLIYYQTKDTPFVQLPERPSLNLSWKQPYCFCSSIIWIATTPGRI